MKLLSILLGLCLVFAVSEKTFASDHGDHKKGTEVSADGEAKSCAKCGKDKSECKKCSEGKTCACGKECKDCSKCEKCSKKAKEKKAHKHDKKEKDCGCDDKKEKAS